MESIKTLEQLSQVQINALTTLKQACILQDGMGVPCYEYLLVNLRAMPSFVLEAYPNEWLAFLTAFYFYEAGCELVLMVHPRLRRRGVARDLLRAFYPRLEALGIQKIYIARPHGLDNRWLHSLGAREDKNECRLSIALTEVTLPPIQLRRATLFDAEVWAEIEETCFLGADLPWFYALMDDEVYQIWVVERAGQVVGKVHLRLEAEAVLSNLGVLTAYRQQGLGQALILGVMASAAQHHYAKLYLDVDGHNRSAFDLYLKMGFRIEQSVDYFLLSLQQMKAFCQI